MSGRVEGETIEGMRAVEDWILAKEGANNEKDRVEEVELLERTWS
jgi:hypothetical protein